MNFREKIIKKLKDKDYFIIGYYKRLYSDTLEETKGLFQINVTYWIDSHYDIIDCEFTIVAKEGKSFEIENIDFYEHYDTEKELFEYIAKFLSQYKTQKEFYDYVYSKFRFIKPDDKIFGNDSLIDLYHLVEDDLEDGTSLEDFIDRIRL